MSFLSGQIHSSQSYWLDSPLLSAQNIPGMMVWLAALFHPSLEIAKKKKHSSFKNILSVMLPCMAPKSEFICLAHTKSHSTAEVLFFSSCSDGKLFWTIQKCRREAQGPPHTWWQQWNLGPYSCNLSLKPCHQVTKLCTLNAARKLPPAAAVLHPSQAAGCKYSHAKTEQHYFPRTNPRLYLWMEQYKSKPCHICLTNRSQFVLGRRS